MEQQEFSLTISATFDRYYILIKQRKEVVIMTILQTKDLKKYYGTEPNITRALDGVNFSVEQGEFVAVVGTSGSGGHVKIRLS